MKETMQNALRSRIDAFATDLTALLTEAVAQAVKDTLGGSATGRGGRGGAKKAAANGRSRAVVNPDDLLRAVAQGGAAGLRMEEIADSMRVPTKSLVKPMKALLAAKTVKRSGQARGTKYRGA